MTGPVIAIPTRSSATPCIPLLRLDGAVQLRAVCAAVNGRYKPSLGPANSLRADSVGARRGAWNPRPLLLSDPSACLSSDMPASASKELKNWMGR